MPVKASPLLYPAYRDMFDADFYNSLSDEDCIICLTEKQVYLAGQIIQQITWSKTRWLGDLSGMDLGEISANYEYRLAERVTCETLTLLATQVAALSEQVANLQNQINQTNILINAESTPDSAIGATELARTLAGDNGCAEDTIFGGIVELVDYIHNQNTQFFGEIEQNIGNSAAVLSDAISAIPVLGLLPFDEGLDLVAQMAENIGQEYATITDEDFLNTVKCDLFCLVLSEPDCAITIDLLLDWVNGHNAFTIVSTTTRLIDIASFLINGTFISNDAFWAVAGFQVYIVSLGENFLIARGIAAYEMQLAAGYNSPDADWAILCDECPDPNALLPMIGLSTCDVGFGPALGTLEFLSGTTWTLEGVNNAAADRRGFLQRTDGGAFHITNQTLISGALPGFYVYKIAGAACTLGATNPGYATQNMELAGWTSPQAQVWKFSFDFIAL